MNNTILVGSDGNSAYSFTAGTRNITITGIPWTLEAKHVAYILNTTQEKLLYAPLDGFPAITVSGGVITFGSAKPELASGDLLHIQLFEPNRGVDEDGYPLVRVLNPDSENYTSPIVVAADEDEVVDTVNRYVQPMAGYPNGGCYVKLYAGSAEDSVRLQIFVTNDDAADDTADTGWVDKTDVFVPAAFLNSADQCIAINETLEFFFWLDQKPCLKMMFKLTYGQSSSGITEDNSADIILVKA